MSSKSQCLRCKKAAEAELISLICDHILCLACAQSLKTLQPHSTLQNKYKIACPLCKKSTVTYDLKNLLLKSTADNLIFQNMENSQLNQSSIADDYRQRPNSQHQNFKQMTYSQRVNNLSRKESRTPDVCFEWKENKGNKGNYESNRASRNGHRQQDYSSICKEHSQNLIFFCEGEKKLLCMECMYKHTKQHKNHKVLSIKNSVGIIGRQNLIFKDETKRKMDELEEYIKITHHNKTILEEKFRVSMEMIGEEFAAIDLMLKTREALIKDTLKNLFNHKEKQLNTEIADLTHLQNCLKQYMNFELEGTSAQIYFFHAYSLLRQAMSKLNLKVHPIAPSSVTLIERSDPQQLKQAIDRIFVLPRQRRPQSRVDSAHPNKHSSILNEQIKNAKKKLEKLEKLQKGEKVGGYLNNFVSNYSREKQRERKSVQVENQKRIGNKAITPTRMGSKIKQKK